MHATAPHRRFREAREQRGLTPEEVATRCGVSLGSIWGIETFTGDLTCCYSPKELQQLCQVLGIRPLDLFGAAISEPAISAAELVNRIHEECRSRNVTLEQFEDVVGWSLSACMDPPERLLTDMTIDGLQWLCRELRVDWRRALLNL